MKGVECDGNSMSSSLEEQTITSTPNTIIKMEIAQMETPRVIGQGEPPIVSADMPMFNGFLNNNFPQDSSNDVEDELDRRIRSHLSHFDAKFEQFTSDVNIKLALLDAKLDQLLQQNQQPVKVEEQDNSTSGEDDADGTLLSTDTVDEVHRLASSARNFALGLVRKLFTKDEMRNSNVNGKQGRTQLNTVRIAFVKDMVVRYYSVPVGKQTTRTWKNCIISIDEGCRRLRRIRTSVSMKNPLFHYRHHKQN